MKKYSFIIFAIIFSAFAYAQNKPYVILVSYDAFRWDYLNRGITPNFDKVKQEGVSALSFRPSFPSKTFPNHLAIITGMYPAHHGIIANRIVDPFTGSTYSMSDSNSVRDAKWYLGEAFWETAERQGIRTASFFWPGSEVLIPFKHPTYYEAYKHTLPYEQRVDGVIKWLRLPQEKRPHFITAYFHETDDQGHRYGPNAPETNDAIKRLDDITGLLIHKLDSIKMKDSVNIIFLSDHGMTEVSTERTINVEKIAGKELCRLEDSGPVMFVAPNANMDKDVYSILKKNENHYKVYYRDEIPESFHFSDHPFIAPIVIIADMGWELMTNRETKWKPKGDHGFDNNDLDMHGIFVAQGPAFKKNYRTGTLWNIDVYPLLCKIFNIMPRANIDGRLDRIGYLLK
jgi:predicted AlkP superfamily pyrophosphatase or phosphodiesterase